MKKQHVLLISILAVLLLFAGTATAWGTSSQIVAVDDQSFCPAGQVCSLAMGNVIFSHYGAGFSWTRVPAATLSAASISTADTVFLYGTNPNNIPPAGKTALVNFVANGGKLIIWDGEDACGTTTCTNINPGHFDYSWLPAAYAFTSYAPGPYGNFGPDFPLTIVENSQLSPATPVLPFVGIDALTMQNTDAVGDANIFTSYVSAHWCVNMEAKNTFALTGPVHLYTKDFGNGIIIYSGFDYDEARTSGSGLQIENVLRNELNANSLPCFVQPADLLGVEKTSDKTTYNVSDSIDFTITIKNNGQTPSYRTTIVDTPPSGVTCPTAPILVGTIAPGATVVYDLICTATTATCKPVENLAAATGFSDPTAGAALFSGSDTAELTIDGPGCGPVETPEFPTLALPIGMILAMMFVVYTLGKKQ
jgi:uncharacterized repeat protein (TIGR01451 family)